MVTLVCGPPCAGKTTWVAERAAPGDLVLDQDIIGAKAMRQGLARAAAMTKGTAWVIRCSPGPRQRDALARHIGATQVVLLQPDEQELMSRAARRDNPQRHMRGIRDWLKREAEDETPRSTSTGRVTRHRVGRPYRRARDQMFRMYGTVCHLCGHEGAGEADHLDAVALDPGQPLDPHTMRPAHGTSSPCPTCGRRCNQAKGTKPKLAIVKTTRAW